MDHIIKTYASEKTEKFKKDSKERVIQVVRERIAQKIRNLFIEIRHRQSLELRYQFVAKKTLRGSTGAASVDAAKGSYQSAPGKASA